MIRKKSRHKEYLFRIHTDGRRLSPISVVRALQKMYGFHFYVKMEKPKKVVKSAALV